MTEQTNAHRHRAVIYAAVALATLLFALHPRPLVAENSCLGWTLNPANEHYYRLTCDLVTWEEARHLAGVDGGYLAIIGDEAENTWIWTTLETAIAGNQSYWIGLSDYSDEGTFVWGDGSIARANGVDLLYTAWAQGDPNDSSGEDFVDIANKTSARPHGTWNDDAAAVVLPGVIERTTPPWRDSADFDNSGCTGIEDFLLLLDNWHQVVPGLGASPLAVEDFLSLLDDWHTGPGC